MDGVSLCLLYTINTAPTAPSQPLEITLVNPATGEYSIQTVAGNPMEGSPLTAFIFRVTKDDEDIYIFKVQTKVYGNMQLLGSVILVVFFVIM